MANKKKKKEQWNENIKNKNIAWKYKAGLTNISCLTFFFITFCALLNLEGLGISPFNAT